MAQHCKFGDAFLDLLRDRIVCGINDEHVQRRLLAEKELSFDKALELAISLETAKKNVTIIMVPDREMRCAKVNFFNWRTGHILCIYMTNVCVLVLSTLVLQSIQSQRTQKLKRVFLINCACVVTIQK